MLEFAGRLNRPDLIIKDFTHWVVILRDEPFTLGSAIIILKSAKPNFSRVSQKEMGEFVKVCRWYESITSRLFGAVKWNYNAVMMRESFVHFQAIPRYEKSVKKYGFEWVDADWPKRHNCNKLDVPKNVITKVLKDMKGE